MIVDLMTYIFRQSDYGFINKGDVRLPNQHKGGSLNSVNPSQKLVLNTTGLVGAVISVGDANIKILSMFATDNQAFLKNADLIGQGTPPIYKGMNTVKLLTYKNRS